MTDITQPEADALVRILSLAENHPMWTSGRFSAPHAEGLETFWDDTYAAIQTVRAFLKRNGVMTLHEAIERLAEKQNDVG